MKTEKIATQYKISKGDFENYVKVQGLKYSESAWFEGLNIPDEFVDMYVKQFCEYAEKKAKADAEEAERKAREAERKAREAERKAREKEQAEAILRAEQAVEDAKKKKAMAEMLITSGFNFDGYTITKYSGYISGDDAISISRGTSGFFTSAKNVGEELTKSLVKIRRNAIKELKEAAYDLGCNAVIGVDFDYITLEPETANSSGGTTYLPYVFCVTANGNAVVIEKNEN